jgi:hypothetical protein
LQLLPDDNDSPNPTWTYISSIFGWKILFMNPIEGDLYGYWAGSSTWIFQQPVSNGAVCIDVKGGGDDGFGGENGDGGTKSQSSVVDVWEGADIYDVKVTPRGLTLAGSVKLDEKLGHAIVDEVDIVIGHQPGPPTRRNEKTRKSSATAYIFDTVELIGNRPNKGDAGLCELIGARGENAYSFITSVSVLRFGELCGGGERRYHPVIAAQIQWWRGSVVRS